MSSTAVAILTLVIGLLIGLALGYLIAGRRTTSDGASTADLATARAERDLYKSERDNAMAGSKLAAELEAMKGAMEKLQKESADADRRRIEAESDIRTQVRAMSTHNESLVAQTKAIAGALSNSQTRGKFGEAQLELMLQDAGLHKDIEYTAQRSTTDADSSGIPDITVRMPGGTKLFIDSKFPFDRFIEAHEVEDPQERERLFIEHKKDLANHVIALAKRGYHESQDSPDFVILFVPFESLLTEALRVDPLFLENAFKVNVTIATPTSMMALLRTIGNVYSRNSVALNAENIAKSAGLFMKDLTLLHSKIVKVGTAINSLSKAYGELIPTAESTVKRAAAKIISYGVTGDKDKLALAYPDAPGEVRELKNSELGGEEDFIDAEEVKDEE
ncbi:COG1322 Predicted nuclease of restriction endonuclease-like fold, RmuC family [Candidatus Nanopelagicaceae bacterium]